jgi:PBP1b-binding outer membrane lipoprotein LpoB
MNNTVLTIMMALMFAGCSMQFEGCEGDVDALEERLKTVESFARASSRDIQNIARIMGQLHPEIIAKSKSPAKPDVE